MEIEMGKKKCTYEEVNKIAKGLGYQLISETYMNNRGKLILKDIDGYFYYSNLSNLKSNKQTKRFHPKNPYSIQNIRLWCKLNDKSFELLSLKYNGNNKKLQWKCLADDCGEIFESCWNDIFTSRGCPFCTGRQVGTSNCLATVRPDLTSEWHPTKNVTLTPYDVTCGSNKKVWWQCRDNPKHEWGATISNRNNGTNCPYCVGKIPSKTNNLLVCNPELCKEWDYTLNHLSPENYTANSDKKVFWVCSNNSNHKWEQKISHRNNGIGCPYCSRQLPSTDYNLLFNSSELCKEWDYNKNKKKPEEYCPNSGKKVWWICKECGYEWEMNIWERNRGRGCPICDMSKGERKIKEYLNKHNIQFEYQKKYEGLIGLGGGLLSYDFYIPQYGLIEFQGEQHEKYIKVFHINKNKFETQLEHDKRKREFAKLHNINLLEIWYWDFNKIKEVLSEELNIKEKAPA